MCRNTFVMQKNKKFLKELILVDFNMNFVVKTVKIALLMSKLSNRGLKKLKFR